VIAGPPMWLHRAALLVSRGPLLRAGHEAMKLLGIDRDGAGVVGGVGVGAVERCRAIANRWSRPTDLGRDRNHHGFATRQACSETRDRLRTSQGARTDRGANTRERQIRAARRAREYHVRDHLIAGCVLNLPNDRITGRSRWPAVLGSAGNLDVR